MWVTALILVLWRLFIKTYQIFSLDNIYIDHHKGGGQVRSMPKAPAARTVSPFEYNICLPLTEAFDLSSSSAATLMPTCWLTWLTSVAWWQLELSPLPLNMLTWSRLPHTNPSGGPGKTERKASEIWPELLHWCDWNSWAHWARCHWNSILIRWLLLECRASL